MRSMIVAVVFAGLAAPAMAQNVGQTLDIAGWKVTRKILSPTMQGCFAGVVSADNMTAFAFGLLSGNASFIDLSDAALKLKKGEDQSLSIRVDNGPSTEVMAYADSAIDVVHAYANVSMMSPLLEAAKKGKAVFLSTGGKSYTFQLAGAAQAIDALTNCSKAFAGGPRFGQVVAATTEKATSSDDFLPADTARIVIQAQLIDEPPGTKISILWIAQKTNGAPPDYHIASSTVTLDGQQHVAVFKLSKPNAGWPLGLYRVELSINDKLSKTVSFTVK